MTTTKASNKDYNLPFPTRLRFLLEEKGKGSQSQLADYIGVTRQAISAYSLGNSVPDIYKFQKMAEFFGVTYAYLLGESESKLPQNESLSSQLDFSDATLSQLQNIANGTEFHETSAISQKNIFCELVENGIINDLINGCFNVLDFYIIANLYDELGTEAVMALLFDYDPDMDVQELYEISEWKLQKHLQDKIEIWLKEYLEKNRERIISEYLKEAEERKLEIDEMNEDYLISEYLDEILDKMNLTEATQNGDDREKK